jgi:hypothetical protein
MQERGRSGTSTVGFGEGVLPKTSDSRVSTVPISLLGRADEVIE